MKSLQAVVAVRHVGLCKPPNEGMQQTKGRSPRPESFHVEMQIGDSTVVVEPGELSPHITPWLGSVHVYVADVDAVHASRSVSRNLIGK
jgi:hypothetical protein